MPVDVAGVSTINPASPDTLATIDVASTPRDRLSETSPTTPSASASTSAVVSSQASATVWFDEKALTQISSGQRSEVFLPTVAPPFSDVVTVGAALSPDGSLSWGLTWLWSAENVSRPDDGRVVSSDWTVIATSPPATSSLPTSDDVVELWSQGDVRFSLAGGQVCPNPNADETPPPEAGIVVSRSNRIIAIIDLLPGPADCAKEGLTLSSTEWVTLLSSLAECSIGGGQPLHCTALPSADHEELERAARVLASSAP